MYTEKYCLIKADELPGGDTLRLVERKSFISFRRGESWVERLRHVEYQFYRCNQEDEIVEWMDIVSSKDDGLKLYQAVLRKERRKPIRRGTSKKSRAG